MVIPSYIYVGRTIPLKAFGVGVIRKIYMHPESHEMCCDVYSAQAPAGLHLSLLYVVRLLA